MSEQNSQHIRFRRILVPVDSSRHSRAALEAAARMAKLAKAELRGLFVEDDDWRRLGRLPSFGEISELTGDLRPVEEQSMEQQIRQLRQRIDDMIREITRRFDVPHRLDTARGTIEQQILEASREADLITIGRAGHSFSKTTRSKIGKTASTIIREAEKPVLLMREGLSIAPPVTVVYDGSFESQRGLQAGREIAEKMNSKLLVIVLKNDQDAIGEERDKEIENLLNEAESQVAVKLLEDNRIWKFAQTVSRLGTGLLVVPKNQPLVRDHSLNELLDYLNCPILLMS